VPEFYPTHAGLGGPAGESSPEDSGTLVRQAGAARGAAIREIVRRARPVYAIVLIGWDRIFGIRACLDPALPYISFRILPKNCTILDRRALRRTAFILSLLRMGRK
jgi:hypothetical protein